MRMCKFTFALLLLGTNIGFAQTEKLRSELIQLIGKFDANVGVSILHLETNDTLTINNNYQYPMQSVYKFPLALVVLKQVDEGKLSLNQLIHITAEEMHSDTWSPLSEEFPGQALDLEIENLLMYTVSKSDNNTCDVLFKLLGGPKIVEQQMRDWDYNEIAIQTTEAEIQRGELEGQIANWCKPSEMSRILVDFYQGKLVSENNTRILLNQMIESSNSAKRIKGKLPEYIVVPHKTGSGNKVVNDVGIINMPDGTHLVISVFICNANEKFEDAEKLIAKIAVEVYDYYDKN